MHDYACITTVLVKIISEMNKYIKFQDSNSERMTNLDYRKGRRFPIFLMLHTLIKWLTSAVVNRLITFSLRLALYGILQFPALVAKWTRRCWYCPVSRYKLFLHSALNFSDKAINANFLQRKQIWQEDPKGMGYLSIPSSVSFSVWGWGGGGGKAKNKTTEQFVRWNKHVWVWEFKVGKCVFIFQLHLIHFCYLRKKRNPHGCEQSHHITMSLIIFLLQHIPQPLLHLSRFNLWLSWHLSSLSVAQKLN